VVELRDIHYEYALLAAQLELVHKDQRLLAATGKGSLVTKRAYFICHCFHRVAAFAGSSCGQASAAK
jgi:hypothetical protein